MIKILLSNDDGVLAPGLRAIYEGLSKNAQVTVIAPEKESSGMSSSISLLQPLRITQLDKDFYSLNGTPADCVHAALTGLLDFIPDIVISGINNRSNLGDDIIYSGTFAAAFEGRMLSYPALALSMNSQSVTPRYDTGVQVCSHILEKLHAQSFFKSGILNINIPDIPFEDIKGYKITQFGHRPLSHSIVKRVDPRGNQYFWLGARQDPAELDDPHTDFYAVKHGFVSISPFNTLMSNQEVISDLQSFFN